jgi:glycosyltransferase involved in cell wall biosynthesis
MEQAANSMNRWLLIAGDFTRFGGMDRANLSLALYLSRQGHQVDVVTHRCSHDLQSQTNVTFHQVRRPLNLHLLGAPLLAIRGRATAHNLTSNGLQVVVNGGNCSWHDVNWVHYVHAAYEAKTVGIAWRRWKAKFAYMQALSAEKRILPRCRLVICNSERTKRDVVDRVGVPPERVHVVYYGCDPQRFPLITDSERQQARQTLGWTTDRPVVTFVGALGDRRKGFDTLFAAWENLCRDKQWDCDLAVIGSGAELTTWRERANAAGIAERVKFLGFRHDVDQVLAACDVLVHPARYEPYGLGVQEAICRGLPALVSATAGIAERYPKALHGLLIPNPNDAIDLAQRLWTWRHNAEHIRTQVTEWSKSIRKYTWDDMAVRIVRLVKG